MTVALRDKRRRDFFWGEKSAIERLEDDAQVAVYVAMLVLSGEGSLVWASQDTLARIAHCSVRTVGRALPDLERLRVIRRADDKTLAALSERLQEVPGTVVYELCNVTAAEPDAPEPVDERTIEQRLEDIDPGLTALARKKAFVAILRKWLAEVTRREISFPWVIRLYDESITVWQDAGEATLLAAAKATVKANPAESVLAYMTKVLRGKMKDKMRDPVLDAHLSAATARQFGEF